MKQLVLMLLIYAASVNLQAQQPGWAALLDQGKAVEAGKLCDEMSHGAALAKRVEAEKCLANVALSKGAHAELSQNHAGGASIGPGFSAKAVDEALVHLNKGLVLAPRDLSLHQGRLHVLEVAGRYDAMLTAVDESATIYKGRGALQHWLAYDSELADLGEAKAGLAFAKVLNRHYPGSHDVLGNIGAFHSMMHETEAALPYLRQAAALAPSDPIDAWNLGLALSKTGATAEADKWMSRAIQLEPVEKVDSGRNCLYADFVEKQVGDAARACKLETASCAAERRTACKAKGAAGSR